MWDYTKEAIDVVDGKEISVTIRLEKPSIDIGDYVASGRKPYKARHMTILNGRHCIMLQHEYGDVYKCGAL